MNHLPDYPAIQFANRIKHENMRILALFLGRRLYFFDKPVEFATQAFARMVADTTGELTLSSHLSKSGYTHCIVGLDQFATWSRQIFSDEQNKIVAQWLQDDCQLLFTKNGYAVFGLIEPR